MGDQLTLTRGPFYTEMSYLISPNPLLLKDTAPINTNTYAGALLLVGSPLGPSGLLVFAFHALRALKPCDPRRYLMMHVSIIGMAYPNS